MGRVKQPIEDVLDKPRATWPTPAMQVIQVKCRMRDDVQRAIFKIDNQIGAICRRFIMSAGMAEDQSERDVVKAQAQAHIKRIHAAVKEMKKAAGSTSGDPASALLDLEPIEMDMYAMIEPFIAAREPLQRRLDQCEDDILDCVKQIPHWKWVDKSPLAKGVGPILYGRLIGASGDLSNYKRSRLLFRRLSSSVVDGQAQGRRKGAEALKHRYSPTRRSLVWLIQDKIVMATVRNEKEVVNGKARKVKGSESWAIDPLGQVYIDELARLRAKNAALGFAERARIEVDRAIKDKRTPSPENLEGWLTAKHIDNMARRRVGQRFLHELWKVWRREARTDLPRAEANDPVPSVSTPSPLPMAAE